MSLRIPFLSKKDFFTPDEKNQVVEAIRLAEKQTSGEIRVYVESRCRFVDPLDRAAEIFWMLKMEATEQRNAVLVYVAVKDRQLALFGDKGIHEKVGNIFWNEKVNAILHHIHKESYADAIVRMVGEIGEALRFHFPYDKDGDKNELSDDIVYGR
ncbi:MAG: TPM domain-containing protein [Bacteroidetes bacterium]|nr:TPM domain-containing protein [Bacteroidota bacterium]